MSKFFTLIKLEFLNSSSHRDDKLFARIRKALFTVIGGAAILGLIVFAIIKIMEVCLQASLDDEFIIYFVTLVEIMQLVIGLSMTTKTFYNKMSVNILKLPLDGKILMFSKIAYLYIKEFFFTTALSLPVFIVYGLKTGAGAFFYCMLAPNLLFLPIIPFFLSILLSIPTIYIMKALQNKFLILLLFYTIVMSVAFIAYIYVLKFILNILDGGDITNVFTSSIIFNMKQFANYLFIPVLFKNSLLGYKFYQSLIINFAMFAFLALLIYIFADKLYLKIVLNLSENKQKSQRKSHIKARSVNKALMFREFCNIFRSSNYAFQYLTVVITTPLMVYFSSEIASSVGAGISDNGILPGIAVLVLIMFLSMGTSFSASTITREGDNFFHTKIIPVSYVRQVTTKFIIYLIVAIPSIMVSCLILAVAGFMSYVGALLIAISISLIVIGNICASISIDIKRPQFKYLDDGEVTSSNMNINSSISVGFIIALLVGVSCIVISYFVNVPSMYLVLYGFGIPFAVIESAMLFCRLEKRYSAIEV